MASDTYFFNAVVSSNHSTLTLHLPRFSIRTHELTKAASHASKI